MRHTAGRVLPPPRPHPAPRRVAPVARAFSRVPFESLDFEPAPRRRRRPRRRRPDDEDDEDDFFAEEEEDEDGLASPVDPPPSLTDAALPGTQVARLKDLQAESEARRDAHFAMYRAHSWKANLLSSVVLICTTAGGTSGLISLTSSMGGGGGAAGGSTGFSGVPMGVPGGGGGTGSTAAALLSPILGYAATLFSGWQQYAKPSTTASRHLTAAKRYQVIARHVRDTLQYGAAANYARGKREGRGGGGACGPGGFFWFRSNTISPSPPPARTPPAPPPRPTSPRPTKRFPALSSPLSHSSRRAQIRSVRGRVARRQPGGGPPARGGGRLCDGAV